MLWLDFFDQFLKLWAVILERRNIFSKKFLAQIIIFDKYFGWFDVQLNQKTLDDLYYLQLILKIREKHQCELTSLMVILSGSLA